MNDSPFNAASTDSAPESSAPESASPTIDPPATRAVSPHLDAALFDDQAALQMAERGGHNEATTKDLFRRLRGARDGLRGGDPTALRDHLVMVHAALVEHCARSFLASGEPMDDLIQEGYVGLIKAVDRFDPDKGVKFSTYACHLISGEIRHYLRDLGRLIHEPGWHFDLRGRIFRASDALAQTTGRAPTPEEIASHLGVKVETVREVLERAQTLHVESLEARDASEESEGRISTLERHQEAGGPTRGDEGRVEDQLFLEEAMPQLRELEQRALRLFFFEEMSKSEIARHLGISVNYASYLLKRGTQGLRRILEAGESSVLPHNTEANLAQQQARATYLLELARGIEPESARRFVPRHKVPALARPGVVNLTQFSSWLDDEVSRVGRYGGFFGVLWLQLRNWAAATGDLEAADRRAAGVAASSLVRSRCRGVDKVAAFASAEPSGLHFLVLMPATGQAGRVLGSRLIEAFAAAKLPAIEAPLHTRWAYAICPDDARITDELFAVLGRSLHDDAAAA